MYQKLIKTKMMFIIALAFAFWATNLNIFAVPNFTFPGAGTETNPFQISTLEDLKELADSVLQPTYYFFHSDKNLHFILTNDITDPVTFCIGDDNPGSGCQSFTGIFDGRGHSITVQLDACFSSNNTVALFPCIRTSGEEVIIKNLTINGYVNGYSAAGGIVGANNSYTNNHNLHNK